MNFANADEFALHMRREIIKMLAAEVRPTSGKVMVNGFNIGRYWEIGPIMTLYVPHGLTHAGTNELVLFETEGRVSDSISLRSAPLINHLEKEGVE